MAPPASPRTSPRPAGSPPGARPGTAATAAIAAALGALVLAVFWASPSHGFVNVDDGLYVTENEVVQGGLSWAAVRWAFTTLHAANWHPLTWLSLLLDVELFGHGPRGHHLTNVALHVAATLALFLVLLRATGARWRSALVAALFGIHPLHVESVAWISERKDVLSTALAFATLAAYQRYAERPGAGRYLAVTAIFALGLLSKPMLVTLPVVLLGWDVWPLGRLATRAELRARVIEKLPLLALSLAAGLVTLLAQREAAVVSIDHLALPARLAQAVHSTGWYLWKTVWPSGLAAFYPYDLQLPGWQVALAGLALVAVSAAVIARRSAPLAVGWGFYLVTLLPVIGIVQVGAQARADRYTYLPLVGVFILAAWAIPPSLSARPRVRPLLAAGAALALAVAAAAARAQVAHWRDGRTLMERAAAVTERNWFAHGALGRLLTEAGELAPAERHLQLALRLAPGNADVRYNAGVLEAALERWPASAASMRRALELRPGWPEAHYNLGRALHAQARVDEAAREYSAAIALRPGYADALNNLGSLHLARGDFAAAEPLMREAARAAPASPFPRVNLGIIYLYTGRPADARRELDAARALGGHIPPQVEQALRDAP